MKPQLCATCDGRDADGVPCEHYTEGLLARIEELEAEWRRATSRANGLEVTVERLKRDAGWRRYERSNMVSALKAMRGERDTLRAALERLAREAGRREYADRVTAKTEEREGA